MFRYRKNYKNHLKHGAKVGCALCDLGESSIVYETEHAFVVKNKFPYDIWEHRTVEDHMLIVPKQHAKGFSDLAHDVQVSVFNLISAYEAEGYDIYARSVRSNLRSVVNHQHTHLIKTVGECAKISLYVEKPYVVAKI